MVSIGRRVPRCRQHGSSRRVAPSHHPRAGRLPAFHTFNIRFDSRRQIGRIALVSFLDVINLYNHLNVNEDRFLELTGKEDRRGFEILPTGGLKVEF